MSFIGFLYCLMLPAYEVAGKQGPFTQGAGMAFAIGWLGFFAGMFEWFANPFLLLSWAFASAYKFAYSALSSAVSLAIALSFLARKQVPLDSAPNYGDIIDRGAGYWLWIASIAIMVVSGALLGLRPEPKAAQLEH